MKLAVPSLVLAAAAFLACTSPAVPKPATAPTTATSGEMAAEGAPECELTCRPATLTAGTPQPDADHHTAAVENVDATFAAMHGDLLACYRAQVAKNAAAHAFVVLKIVLNPNGGVRRVESTGGAMLGNEGLRCITRRVERATFATVHGGGTLEIEVPLEFRSLSAAETQ